MASSAFSLTAICGASAFEVTKGKPVIGGLRDPALQHFFYGDCMTWLFTRPDLPTMLEEHRWFAPFMEPWTPRGCRGQRQGPCDLSTAFRRWRPSTNCRGSTGRGETRGRRLGRGL